MRTFLAPPPQRKESNERPKAGGKGRIRSVKLVAGAHNHLNLEFCWAAA
jgi:hypothetical protein